MNNLFLRLKNLPFYLSLAFIFSALTLLFINTLTLIPSTQMEKLYAGVNSAVTFLFALAAGVMINYRVCKNTRKALAAGFSLLLFDAVLFTLCGVHISFLLSIILSLAFSFITEKLSLINAFAVCSLISLAIALGLGLSYDLLLSLLKSFCTQMKGRGAIIGMINNAYSLAFSENLASLFYNNDYSGTAYVNGEIVSGVTNIFKAQGVAGDSVSRFLTGKYFVNIFLSLGIFALLFNKLEDEKKTAFSLCFALGVIFGDVRLFALFVLVYNPIMYLGYLALIIVSYLTAYLLDIRIAYERAGSVFELFRDFDKPFYFILAGVVLSILTYFLESIIISKVDFSGRKILPKEVRQIVKALGGERNIERAEEGIITVTNPNLINILSLDCEIKGDKVTLLPDDFDLIYRFFKI
ncbi:MAG: hypothetical protein E7570_09245 [Ruminococcaceae bacterium]|nr:hypothetical protein [Oscillospiraceae bacterium]